jgi:hypothetical protein
MAAAIADVMNGTWTQADLTLIQSDPTVAGQVPDPTASPEIDTTEYDDPTTAPAIPDGADTSTADESADLPAMTTDTANGLTTLVTASSGTKIVDAWYADKRVLGSIIYRYHEVVEYSYNVPGEGPVTTIYPTATGWPRKARGL